MTTSAAEVMSESYRFMTEGDKLEKQAPSYSSEEARLLKAHITGQLTKHLNNLKLIVNGSPQEKPFMYDFMQGVIGVATYLFYFCAGPAICLELKKIEIADFYVLLFDKIFRKRWLLAEQLQHSYNMTPKINSIGVIDETSAKSMNSWFEAQTIPTVSMDNTTDTLNKNFFAVLTPLLPVPTQAVFDRLKPYYDAFQSHIDSLGAFLSSNTLGDCLKHDEGKTFLRIIEDLRTIYVFYYKGGNSIRTIIEQTNMRVNDGLKISDLDELIPYGSDFDTNLLINPFLRSDLFNNIKYLIEIFIPQISQYIALPNEFIDQLLNPTEDIFKSDSDPSKRNEQEQQMEILKTNWYELNSFYLNPAKRDPNRADYLTQKERMFYISPQYSIDPATGSKSGIIRTKMSFPENPDDFESPSRRFTSSTFPYAQYEGTHYLRRHFNNNLKDTCFDSLQYSINKTIPKFELYRYFLNFKLGERIVKTNSKYRLLDVDGIFNAEMLDISIVLPTYVPDKDEKTVSCELLELWTTSIDMFKIVLFDQYNLLGKMQVTLPSAGDLTAFSSLPIFINSIEMQMDDLSLAISDTIIENKLEKLGKRLKRISALHYTKVISPDYKKSPFNEILIPLKIIELDTPVDIVFMTKLGFPRGVPSGITEDESKKLRKFFRAFNEYFVSNCGSFFYLNFKKFFNFVQSRDQSRVFEFEEYLIEWMKWYINYVITISKSITLMTAEDHIKTLHENIIGPLLGQLIFFNIGEPNVTTGEPFVTELKLGDSETIQFQFNRILMTIPNFDRGLSVILKNPENNYRIPAIFVACFSSQFYSGATKIEEFSYQDSIAFINFLFDVPYEFKFDRRQGAVPTSLEFASTDSTVLQNYDFSYIKFLILFILTNISEKFTIAKINGSTVTAAANSTTGMQNSLKHILSIQNYFTKDDYSKLSLYLADGSTGSYVDRTGILQALFTADVTGSSLLEPLTDGLVNEIPESYPPIIYMTSSETFTWEDDATFNELFLYNTFLSTILNSPIYLKLTYTTQWSINELIMYSPENSQFYNFICNDTDGSSWTLTPVSIGNIGVNIFRENPKVSGGFELLASITEPTVGGRRALIRNKKRRLTMKRSNRKIVGTRKKPRRQSLASIAEPTVGERRVFIRNKKRRQTKKRSYRKIERNGKKSRRR
jgi:hypothetical protein